MKIIFGMKLIFNIGFDMKLLFTILLTLTICTIAFGQMRAETIIHRYTNMTIYESASGPNGGEYDMVTATFKDTCWVGTEVYQHHTLKGKRLRPQLVRYRIDENGINQIDLRAVNGIEKMLEKELKSRPLDWMDAKGELKQAKKSLLKSEKKLAKEIINEIRKDPSGVVVFDIYEFPTLGGI